MQVFYDLDSFPPSLQGGAVSVGKYDGVHLGHALIIHRLKSHAGKLQAPAIVLTFDPPPISILRPDLNIRPICTLHRKLELLETFKLDAVVVFPATRDFLKQSAETFFFGTLVEQLKARVIVEGKNFNFGRDRVGTSESIKSYGQWTGVEIDIVEPVQLGDSVVSSSGIRRMLAEGMVEHVNELMPLPYQLRGNVVDGDHRGRTLGFPTANLADVETVIPKSGVYASVVSLADRQWTATTHIGSNPTFNVQEPRIESFLHDFDGDLYGAELHVNLLAYQREIVRFDSQNDLIKQIRIDIRQSREICQSLKAGSQA